VIDLGLLDELELHIAPVILGDGLRLLDHRLDTLEGIELTPNRVTATDDVRHIRYRVRERRPLVLDNRGTTNRRGWHDSQDVNDHRSWRRRRTRQALRTSFLTQPRHGRRSKMTTEATRDREPAPELRHRRIPAGDARIAVFTRTYDTTIEDLWDACTNPDRLRQPCDQENLLCIYQERR
jgi:hypothetical protein